MRSRIILAMFVSRGMLAGIGMMRFSLTVLQQLGPLETRTANLPKRFVIRLASRRGIPAPPVDTRASIEAGGSHYGLDCGICHGVDGRPQMPSWQWMYPQAADLTSKQMQGYSDQELFWIINNGIRFTGMPGFSKVETPGPEKRCWIAAARGKGYFNCTAFTSSHESGIKHLLRERWLMRSAA